LTLFLTFSQYLIYKGYAGIIIEVQEGQISLCGEKRVLFDKMHKTFKSRDNEEE